MLFGQFHYGVCYYPEHWHPSRHATDIARMAEAGFNLIRLGESAWSYWEPREGQFQFEMFDRVLDLCAKHKIKAIMGTPTYAAPAWVPTQYPEVLRWNFDRTPMAHGSRRNLTYNSPKYNELSDRICTALAEHYKGHPQILGWQLDNEFNCHMDVSYAPCDTAAFRRWLQAKYKTLDALNAAWGTSFWSQTYDSWEQIDLPHPTATYLNPSQLLDESRFISDSVVAFAKRQGDILRKADPQWKLTHNALFNHVKGPDLAKVLDFFSHDQYPQFWSHWTGPSAKLLEARSLSFPYAILEQQSGPGGQMSYLHATPRPGQMRLWAWATIFHGAQMLSFFRWRTCPFGSEQHWHGILDQDDRPNRRLAEATALGEEIRSLPPAFFEAPVAKAVGVLRDYDNEMNFNRINTYTKEGHGETWGWLADLSMAHIPVDVLWPGSTFYDYKVIVIPHFKIVTPELVAKLVRFVEAGGVLVLGAQSGLMDINCHIVEKPLPGLFRDLAGVEVEDWTTLKEKEVRTAKLDNGVVLVANTFVERLKPVAPSVEVLAKWLGDDTLLANGPAVTRNKLGLGAVYYLGGYGPSQWVKPMIGVISKAHGLAPVCEAGPDVEAVQRVAPGGSRYLCLMNHSANAEKVRGLTGWVALGDLTVEDGSVTLPPYGVAVIESR